jgi:hypothetical protein
LVLLTIFLIPSAYASYDTLLDLHSGTSLGLFGRSTGFIAKNAIQYIPTANHWVCNINLDVEPYASSPTDGIQVIVYSNGTGQPETGSLITSSAIIPASSLPAYDGSVHFTNFSFPNCFLAGAGASTFFVIQRTGALSNSNYYAEDYANYDASSQTIYWTSPSWGSVTSRDFNVQILGNLVVSGLEVPNLASTSNPFSTCGFTDIPCQIGNAFYKVTSYLFVPSSASYNQFTGLWDMVKAKPPVGYLTTTITAFNSLSYSSGSYALSMTGFTPFTDQLKTGLTWILWIMLGFWILHRIRLLDL